MPKADKNDGGCGITDTPTQSWVWHWRRGGFKGKKKRDFQCRPKKFDQIR